MLPAWLFLLREYFGLIGFPVRLLKSGWAQAQGSWRSGWR